MKKHISGIIIFVLVCTANAQTCQNKKFYPDQQKSIVQDIQAQNTNARSDTVDILKYTINLNITDFITNKI